MLMPQSLRREAIASLPLGVVCGCCLSITGGANFDEGDAGRDGGCTYDAQCPTGDYCDFSSVMTCAWNGGELPLDGGGSLGWGPFGRAVKGACIPGSGSDSQCQSAEDCPEQQGCFGSQSGPECTLAAPCPHGGL